MIQLTTPVMAALVARNPNLAHAVAEVIEARSAAARRTLKDLNEAVKAPQILTESLSGRIRAFFKLP